MKIGKSRLTDEIVDNLVAATYQAIADFEQPLEGRQITLGQKSWCHDGSTHPTVSAVADLQSDENWTPNIPGEAELRIRFRNFVELSEYDAEQKRFRPVLFQLKNRNGALVNVMVQAKFQLGLVPRRTFGNKR